MVPETSVFRPSSVAPGCVTGRSTMPLNSDTPSDRGRTDFNVIHTRVPASSLITGGAGIACECPAVAAGAPSPAGPTEGAATEEFGVWPAPLGRADETLKQVMQGLPEAAVSTARVPRPDGEAGVTDADSPGGACSGSGGDEIDVLSGLLGVGGARTAVSVGWTPPSGAVGEVLGGPIRLGSLDAMVPPRAGFGGI
jgi:hypothetical protein